MPPGHPHQIHHPFINGKASGGQIIDAGGVQNRQVNRLFKPPCLRQKGG